MAMRRGMVDSVHPLVDERKQTRAEYSAFLLRKACGPEHCHVPATILRQLSIFFARRGLFRGLQYGTRPEAGFAQGDRDGCFKRQVQGTSDRRRFSRHAVRHVLHRHRRGRDSRRMRDADGGRGARRGSGRTLAHEDGRRARGNARRGPARESERARAHASPRHQVREPHRHRAHARASPGPRSWRAGARGSRARAEAEAGENRLDAIYLEPRTMRRRYSLERSPVFMRGTLANARRRRRFSGGVNLLDATRQLAVNTPGSGVSGPGHASCDEWGMATQTLNRRESDRIPMGVESAMPCVPAPSSESVRPPKAKRGILGKLVLALLALIFLFGVWQIGMKLYIQANAPVAQVIDKKG